MRKKSHISLAAFLVRHVSNEEFKSHKKLFCLASIFPDCKFSFLTKKHAFQDTFEEIKERITNLSSQSYGEVNGKRRYVVELSEIMHYLADYFTFPHNDTYQGSIKEHCIYEGELKRKLRSYVKSSNAIMQKDKYVPNYNVEDILAYIKESHGEYLSKQRSVEEDCDYIVRITYQVMEAILLCKERQVA
ncbi:MAG: zinc dependent phospholipase C family protein [Eubacteriales bacterium]